MDEFYKKAATTRLVIFDIDGVLTDGSLFLGDDGQQYKAFNSKDGHGLKMLQQSGTQVAIITAKQSNVVKIRMDELGIEHVYQGQSNKLNALEDIVTQLNIPLEAIAYVGDDVIDLPVMIRVGLPIAVADAHPFVKRHALWSTTKNGGQGAAREVCEAILQGQGKLNDILQHYIL